MADNTTASTTISRRTTTRRAVLGGTLAAGSVAAAYAALGDKLDLFGGGGAPEARFPQDTDAISQESVKINHLLRRAGFGMSRDEYDHYQSLGLDRTIDELVNFTVVDDSAALAAASQIPIDDSPAARANLPL